MTTLAQIQRAMGPVYLAWATPATDHHFIQPAQARTTISGAWPELPKPKLPTPAKIRTKEILAYLAEHGAKTSVELAAALGVTKRQVRLASDNKYEALFSEQVGFGADRTTLYWVATYQPDISQRSTTYQLWAYFLAHPWKSVLDIPTSLVSHKTAHTYACDLERKGRLVSKVKMREGQKIKHYKAVP